VSGRRLSVVVALLLVATPAGTTRAAARTTVTVEMTGFEFVLSRRSVPHGVVAFQLVNEGGIPHEFTIEGKSSEMVLPGRRATFVIKFRKPGRYPYLCEFPGHAHAGMKGVLRVT
jgi:uncharacterized cupredoxin-like copper-binding protein